LCGADEVLILIIDDGVEGDGRLAGLSVADDELALAPADGRHAVDGLESGLHRLLDGLTFDHTRGDTLDPHGRRGVDGTLAVDRLAQGVHDAAQQLLAGGNLHDAAGPPDLVAFLDQRGLAEQHGADVVFLEVQRHAHHAVRQLQQLAGHRLLEAVDSRDPVTDTDDRPHLGQIGLFLVILDLGADDLADFVDLDLHDYS